MDLRSQYPPAPPITSPPIKNQSMVQDDTEAHIYNAGFGADFYNDFNEEF